MTDTINHHYWQGAFIGDDEAADRLAALPAAVEAALAEPLDTETVLAACDALAAALRDPGHAVRDRLAPHLPAGDAEDAAALYAELAAFLDRSALTRKLRRELGGAAPQRLNRPDAKETVYEAWAPVGLVAHIAPGNAATVAPLSVVEGLLAGNVNVLKTSGTDTLLAPHLLAELVAQDPTGALAERVIVLRFPSSRQDWLRLMCAPADAVAVWGGESAVAGVAAHVPAGCRLVEWGHKISFAYLTRDAWADGATLDALAEDICLFEQQACSSPQVVYLDTEDTGELHAFCDRLAAALAARPAPADQELDPAEYAELTTTEHLARLEEHLGFTRVLAAPDRTWRVMADIRPALTASPAPQRLGQAAAPQAPHGDAAPHAPLPPDGGRRRQPHRHRGTLRPGPGRRSHPGHARRRHDRRLLRGTARRRLRPPALQPPRLGPGRRTLRRHRLPRRPRPPGRLPRPAGPLLDKNDVRDLNRGVDRADAELYFRSGGSTGAPALSLFTYEDYDTQMRAAARGLLAAGYDPARDRTANLFYCGGMYGGFISFFSILERLGGVQMPMAAGPDHRATAEMIVAYEVDTLFGMPSYLWQLLHEEADLLRSYGGLRKIYYGGEHFTDEQRRVLTDTFGIEVVHSITYGSTDLGPLGYQCTRSTGGVHHLHADLHTLEIVEVDTDRPVASGETGRLVFTTRARRGQHLDRYVIGDLGRALPGRCPCGSHAPRFELLGRLGEVMRVATYFLNHRRFVAIAAEHLGHAGEMQTVLTSGTTREGITLRMERSRALDPDTAREAFLAAYPEVRSAVEEKLLDFTVEAVDGAALFRTPTSGKLPAVVDRRRGQRSPDGLA